MSATTAWKPEIGKWCISKQMRVTYRDTDKMGQVYYANYLVWFEIGRTDWLRESGRTYRDWEEKEDAFLPVRRCEINYTAPALYDDLIRVETMISSISRASVIFNYRIIKEDGVVCATGITQHPLVNGQGKIVRRMHELLPQMFNNP